MVELLIGIILGGIIVFSAKVTGFEKDRSFYPVLLIVIALYYVLFALQSYNKVEIPFEIALALLFLVSAVCGHHKGLKIVASGLILHGIYDVLQGNIPFSPNPPEWWPLFCLGIDVTLGIWLLWTSTKSLKKIYE